MARERSVLLGWLVFLVLYAGLVYASLVLSAFVLVGIVPISALAFVGASGAFV